MFGAAGSLADASRAFETYRQVDALDTRVRAGVADATAEGAEPAERCVGDVWDDQTASLVLSYRNTAPKYTPRPGAETGAQGTHSTPRTQLL